jgi:hypothetical protein
MDIVKYFYEEPAALAPPASGETRASHGAGADAPTAFLDGPRLYRGYLAGTHLPEGDAADLRIGATALDAPDAWLGAVLALFDGTTWSRLDADGGAEVMGDAESVAAALRDPAQTHALAAAPMPVPAERLQRAAGTPRRAAVETFFEGEAAHALLLPEPAHDGFDWSLFSAVPLRDRFAAALARRPAEGARRFVVPYRRARSEHLFYFEQWQLDELPAWVEEV